MIGFKHARLVNSNLDLNGPELSFTTQPVSATTNQDTATLNFNGAATGSFPAGQTERSTNTGSIAYQWYKNGAALTNSANVTGATTASLTLTGLNYGDNDDKVYLSADYVNSAYGGGLTPNAISEPKNSDEVSILVQPTISITEQPVGQITASNTATTFTVVALSEDELNDQLSFEWFIDGQSINTLDYLPDITRSVSNTSVFAVMDLPNNPNFDLRVPAIKSTLTINGSTGSSNNAITNTPSNVNWASGVTVSGWFASDLRDYMFDGNTSVFSKAESDLTSILNFLGWDKSQNSSLPTLQGPVEIFIRYASFANYTFEVNGQTVSPDVSESGDSGAFVTLTNGSLDSFKVTAPQPNFNVQISAVRSNGVILQSVQSTQGSVEASAGLHKVGVTVSHPNCNPGSLSSGEVNLDISADRKIIQFERYDGASSILADSGKRDIAAFGALAFRANAAAQSRAIAIWAPEEDINVKITMGGGAGADRNGNKGGEGGISVFKVKLKKNEEYQIKLGVNETQGGGPKGGTNGGGGSAIIYHKAKVIAVCGGGGGAGTGSDGGDGGGVQVAGEDGDGSSSGSGGRTYSAGSLPSEGSFPSDTSGTALSSCTIGKYYRDLGFSPCQDVGIEPYRYADGRTFSGSALIQRGYKSGNAHRNNGGNATGNQGGGGAGAHGGSGATAGNSGGGGGSGYGTGDIQLLNSIALPSGRQLGGNDGVGFIAIELFELSSSFDNTDPYAPFIPPDSEESFREVTFTVTRTTQENIGGAFTKTSGIGPEKMIFGPNESQYTAQIERGSVYTLTSESNVDTRSLNQQDNTLTLSDTDSNPGQLNITSDIGQFTTSTTIDQDCRWVANW